MDCRQIGREDLVEKYLQGRLVGAAQDDFEVHILQCAKCLQVLEAFQGVGDDLVQRAHEIRAQPVTRRAWFGVQWQWAAVVSMLAVVCGLGVLLHLRHHITASSQPQSVEVSKPPIPSGEKDAGAETLALPPPVLLQPQHKEKGNPPKSGYGPKVAPVTPSSQKAEGTATASIPTVQPSEQTPLVPTKGDKTLAPATAHGAEGVPKPELATDEVEKELFRLGTVQAPPYTFSGLATDFKVSPGGKSGSSNSLDSGSGAKPSGNLNQKDAVRVQFQNAMLAYVDRRYVDAEGMLEEVLKLDPKAADANLYLGVCRLLLGRPADAVGPLNTALENAKSTFAQPAHFYLAKAYVQTGNLAEAEAQLQAAAAIGGRLSTQARSELGQLQTLRSKEAK